jgi:hypothetical protein
MLATSQNLVIVCCFAFICHIFSHDGFIMQLITPQTSLLEPYAADWRKKAMESEILGFTL